MARIMTLIALALLMLAPGPAIAADAPIRLLLVVGGHTHAVTFYEPFIGQTDYAVTVTGHPGAFKRGMEKAYNVIVLYDMADVKEDSEKKNLQAYLESGKGLVVLHHALCDNQQWPWWYEEVVGGLYVTADLPGKQKSSFKHDEEMKVRPVAKHPVVDGVGPFTIYDETYKNMWHSPKIQVLLECDHPLSDKPVAWISPYQKSRVVALQLGHGPEAHQNPNFRKLLKNAIVWASGK
jgi:type 1 glutamine amidotransferase